MDHKTQKEIQNGALARSARPHESDCAAARNPEADAFQEILTVNASLITTPEDAENAQRGFLLTGNDLYLQPYRDAVAAIPLALQRFQTIAARRSDFANDLRQIAPRVAAKLSALKTTIDMRRANRLPEALEIVETDRGNAYMDQIRSISSQIEQKAQRREAVFETEASASARTLRLVSTGGSTLLAAFLAFATMTVFRGMNRRDELARKALAGEKLLATTLSGIADGVIATDARARISSSTPPRRNSLAGRRTRPWAFPSTKSSSA